MFALASAFAATPPSLHWAFVPPTRLAPPAVKQTAWPRNGIDQFILARLDTEGIKPSPEADRTTLVRRLSLDLTGLSPTIAEVEQFLADQRPDAYERLVEQFLSSPHYGERWGRHWLDLARYAVVREDGQAKKKEVSEIPEAWRYRDWVVDAFNCDLPTTTSSAIRSPATCSRPRSRAGSTSRASSPPASSPSASGASRTTTPRRWSGTRPTRTSTPSDVPSSD